jgi:predicted SnoaL-like aldol condensation-catalyzing enzyme
MPAGQTGVKMIQTVMPRGEAPVDYQEAVVGVLSTLVGDKGTISGPGIHPIQVHNQNEIIEAIGSKPLIKFFAAVNSALTRYTLNIENLVVKGEKVMVKYTIQGVLSGKLMGLTACGGNIRVTVVDVFRLDYGRIVEYWNASQKIETLTSPLKN